MPSPWGLGAGIKRYTTETSRGFAFSLFYRHAVPTPSCPASGRTCTTDLIAVERCLVWHNKGGKANMLRGWSLMKTRLLLEQPAWIRSPSGDAAWAPRPPPRNRRARVRSCMNIAALGCGALLDFFRVRLRHGLRIDWLPPDALLNDGSRLLLACALAPPAWLCATGRQTHGVICTAPC
jgi:hypothetical protein